MANYFTLTPKGASDPATFQSIDDNMREAFGAPPDAVHWFHDWYDVIGLGLAMGYSWDKLRDRILHDDPLGIRICNWLESHYDADSWASYR